MDPTKFRNGMHLLAVLPSPSGPVDARGIEQRLSVYKQLFAEDDGEMFERACLLGVQTVWKFYPSPAEIREQMNVLLEQRQRERDRIRYARMLEATEAKAKAEMDERIRHLQDDVERRKDAERLAGEPSSRRGGDILSIAEVIARRAAGGPA
jgi:hypothetical protein